VHLHSHQVMPCTPPQGTDTPSGSSATDRTHMIQTMYTPPNICSLEQWERSHWELQQVAGHVRLAPWDVAQKHRTYMCHRLLRPLVTLQVAAALLMDHTTLHGPHIPQTQVHTTQHMHPLASGRISTESSSRWLGMSGWNRGRGQYGVLPYMPYHLMGPLVTPQGEAALWMDHTHPQNRHTTPVLHP
jgi:hypothetical protein